METLKLYGCFLYNPFSPAALCFSLRPEVFQAYQKYSENHFTNTRLLTLSLGTNNAHGVERPQVSSQHYSHLLP